MTFLEFCQEHGPEGLLQTAQERKLCLDFTRWRQCCNDVMDVWQDILGEILLPILAKTQTRQGLVRLSEEDIQYLENHQLVIDPGMEWYDADARRPYYRLRGRRITPDEAFEVIRRTDAYFTFRTGYESGKLSPLHLQNWWFNKNHYPARYGWVHPDGLVGADGITGSTYPTTGELVEEMLMYQRAFPFLEFVLALTDWDEMPPYAWDQLFSDYRDDYQEYPDFLDHIELGIYLGPGKLELMGPERARQAYQKAVAEWVDVPRERYISQYNQDHDLFPADDAYLKRCLEANGDDAELGLQMYQAQKWL